MFSEVSLSSRGAHGVVLIWFGLFGGFVFLALIVPWTVAVSLFPNGNCSGKLYFTFVGAILVFVLGCALSSLVPKPLFIEDQTFVEGFIIALKRKGSALRWPGACLGPRIGLYRSAMPVQTKQSVRRPEAEFGETS